MPNVTPLQELDKFMAGALQERVGKAVSEIAANIFDPNTDATATRKVTIELTLKPSKTRTEAVVTTAVTTKLAPLSKLEADAQIGIEQSTGALVIVERTNVTPGQIDIQGETHTPNVARFPAKAN